MWPDHPAPPFSFSYLAPKDLFIWSQVGPSVLHDVSIWLPEDTKKDHTDISVHGLPHRSNASPHTINPTDINPPYHVSAPYPQPPHTDRTLTFLQAKTICRDSNSMQGTFMPYPVSQSVIPPVTGKRQNLIAHEKVLHLDFPFLVIGQHVMST